MKELKTYDGHGEPCLAEFAYFVRKSDFDAAMAEIEDWKQESKVEADAGDEARREVAALREELASAKADEKMLKDEDLKWQLIRELGAEINALKIKLEEKEKTTSYLHQRAIISSQAAASLRTQLELSENSLTAAEQRNAECIALLRRSTSAEGQDLKTWWNDRALILQAALTKTTESGASE